MNSLRSSQIWCGIKIRKAELYTIMVDSTTDKNNEEIQGIVVSFFSSDTGEIEERLLNIGSSGRSANGIFQFVHETLDKAKISFDGMVSQAFDGASVMSGQYSGLQALICEFCGRNVVYIHCFCHRLHLVVTAAMNNIEELKDHFDTVSALYKSFKLAAVKEEYSGGALKRLIETQWSGHFVSCKAINDNYTEIIKTLPLAAKNKKLDSSECDKAYGFQIQAHKDEFIFLNHLIVKILKSCDIANKLLQSSTENLNSAIMSIDCVREELKEKRNEYSNEEIAHIVGEVKSRQEDNMSPPTSRTRKVPRRLDDFFVTDRLPPREDTDLRRISVECLDQLEEEFSRRFSQENTALWSSMECLLPSSANFMDTKQLEPLFRYAMEIPAVKEKLSADSLNKQDFQAECRIYKRILSKQDRSSFENETRKTLDMTKICAFMVKNHANNAPILTLLYRVAVTAGYASARVECVFSALTKVDAPQRRRMSTRREANLTFLHFERKTLMSLRFEDFLKVWREKPRKLSFD